MDLHLWAQLNLIGHVSYESYLAMDPAEAMACYKALEYALSQSQAKPQAHPGFDELCNRQLSRFASP